MHPVGDHISLSIPVEEPSLIVLEKEPLKKAIVKEVSPDIIVPFKPGDQVYISDGRQIHLNDEVFISSEHIFLYK